MQVTIRDRGPVATGTVAVGWRQRPWRPGGLTAVAELGDSYGEIGFHPAHAGITYDVKDASPPANPRHWRGPRLLREVGGTLPRYGRSSCATVYSLERGGG